MWSPTKLDFLFYDFSVIYYDFSKIQPNKLKRKRQNLHRKKFVPKHTILYVHYVDLLMWSATKLDFLFYDLSVIYYDFSKI
jgi:hypothetical protein